MVDWVKDLPSCVGQTIFSKLAISNLPACRLVCKTWNDAILDYASFSQFQFLTNAFLLSTAALNGGPPCKPKIHCFNLDSTKHLDLDLDLELNKSGSLQFEGNWSFVHLSNQCNGLVFLFKSALYDIYDYDGIFNPMTNEFVDVVPVCPFGGEDIYLTGFGFSPTSKQYKLFRVADSIEYYGTIVPDAQKSRTTMDVFTFGRSGTSCNPNHNQWRHLHDLPFAILRSGAYLNGVIYWLGKEKDNEKDYVIYALDVETEQIELSAVLQVGPCSTEGGMDQSNGTIYMTFYTNWATISKTIEVWRMRGKDSWIRDFVIDDIPSGWLSFGLIKVFEDGAIFCLINMEYFCFYNRFSKRKMMVSKNQNKSIHICQIDSLNFGSLSETLAGMGN